MTVCSKNGNTPNALVFSNAPEEFRVVLLVVLHSVNGLLERGADGLLLQHVLACSQGLEGNLSEAAAVRGRQVPSA